MNLEWRVWLEGISFIFEYYFFFFFDLLFYLYYKIPIKLEKGLIVYLKNFFY